MNWFIYSLLTILLYGIHDILLKRLSGGANALVSGLIINLGAAAVLLLVWLMGFARGGQSLTLKDTSLMLVAGAALGLATVTFIQAFASQGAFSVVVPVVYVGIIAISVLAGYTLFSEAISYKQLVGIALACINIYLMAKG